MKKELDYLIIYYSDKDKVYIDYIVDKINNKSKEIVDFFDVKVPIKSEVKLYDDLDKFRKDYKIITKKDPKDWVCGLSYDNKINSLTLEELKKTYNHENNTIEDLYKLILHEFVHSINNIRCNNSEIWLKEGLATYLSGQYPNSNEIKVSYEEIINGTCSYTDYRALVKYIIENYDHDYILKLIDDNKFLLTESKRLYEEALYK